MKTELNLIKFQKLKFKNFMSFGENETEINFEKHNGLTYISGKNNDLPDTYNGCGKSNCTDAIIYALFGRTSKNVNKPNIVNRATEKECLVELLFSVNNKNYKILSSIKPTLLYLYEYSEEITDWKDLTKSTIKETQQYLETEILHSSYEIFKSVVLLSVSDTVSIYKMQKHEKRNFLEKSFNLGIIGMMYKKCKEDLNAVEKEKSKDQSIFIKYEDDLKNFKRQLETYKEDKQTKIKKLTEEVNQLKKDKVENFLDNSSFLQQKKEIELKLNKYKEQKQQLEIAKTKLQSEISSLDKEIKQHHSVQQKFSGITDIICISCKDMVDKEFKLIEIQTRIEQCNNTISSHNEKLEKLKVLNTKLVTEIQSNNTQLTSLNLDIELVNKNIIFNNILDNKISSLEVQIKDTESKQSPFENLLSNYTKERNKVYDLLKQKIEKKKYLEYISYLLSEDGVKKFIISNIVNILNVRIRKYLDELSANYTVILSPDFNAKFLTASGECEYGNFSAGEQRRIELATALALRDVLFSQGALRTNLLVCDEILDTSLDENSVNHLIKILRREADNGVSIFLISHRECIDKESSFDHFIEVNKTNGFSNIDFNSTIS